MNDAFNSGIPIEKEIQDRGNKANVLDLDYECREENEMMDKLKEERIETCEFIKERENSSESFTENNKDENMMESRSIALGLAEDTEFPHKQESKRVKTDSGSAAAGSQREHTSPCSRFDKREHSNNTPHTNDISTDYVSHSLFFVTKDGKLNCSRCKFIATKSESIDLHQIVHETTKPYQCTMCKYENQHKGHFNKHILIHNNDRPINCPYCAKSFTKNAYLQNHVEVVHPCSVLECDGCDFTASLPMVLAEHRRQCRFAKNYDKMFRTVLIDGEAKLRCCQCSFIATKVESLKLHQIVHDTGKPYQCPQCVYQTTFFSRFNSHILTHNEEKLYKCPVPFCPKSFTNAHNQRGHIESTHPDTNVTMLSKSSL